MAQDHDDYSEYTHLESPAQRHPLTSVGSSSSFLTAHPPERAVNPLLCFLHLDAQGKLLECV